MTLQEGLNFVFVDLLSVDDSGDEHDNNTDNDILLLQSLKEDYYSKTGIITVDHTVVT